METILHDLRACFSVAFLDSLASVGGSQFEDAVTGPARKQAERSGMYAKGSISGRLQPTQDDTTVASVVAADEAPILSPDDLAAQIQLRTSSCMAAPVVEETTKRTRWSGQTRSRAIGDGRARVRLLDAVRDSMIEEALGLADIRACRRAARVLGISPQ